MTHWVSALTSPALFEEDLQILTRRRLILTLKCLQLEMPFMETNQKIMIQPFSQISSARRFNFIPVSDLAAYEKALIKLLQLLHVFLI